MTKRLIGYIAGAVLLVSLALGFAIAQNGQDTNAQRQPGQRKGGQGFERGMGGPFARLDLTDDQKAQMKAIFEAQQTNAKPLRQQLRAKEQALHAAETATDFNAQAIRAASLDLAATETELTVLRAEAMHKALAILTPEQQTKLKEMRGRHHGQQDGAGGPRGRKAPGGNPIQN